MLFFQWVLLNCAPNSTQSHPPHLTPFTSTQLHPPTTSLFQSPPGCLQHPQRYKNQNVARIWVVFQKLGRKINSKLFVLRENWHIWYLGGVDPENGFRYSNFEPQHPFLGKDDRFAWRLVHLVSWRSLLHIWTFIFKISTPKSIFEQIWAEKRFPVYFYLKLCCCFWTYS